MPMRRKERLIIEGRVQGVGYRDWLVTEGRRLGLTGWVRNVGQDRVEAVLCGGADAVERMIALCRQGTRWASVTAVERFTHDTDAYQDFRRAQSV